MESFASTIIRAYGEILGKIESEHQNLLPSEYKGIPLNRIINDTSLENMKTMYEKQYKIYQLSKMIECTKNLFNRIFNEFTKTHPDSARIVQYFGIFGGFVRDWVFPCVLEGLHPLDLSSPSKMLEKFPNMLLPVDIDVYTPIGMINHFGSDFCKLLSYEKEGSACNPINRGLHYPWPLNTFSISLPLFHTARGWKPSFHIDFTYTVSSYDFDVNRWRYNPYRGLFLPKGDAISVQIGINKESSNFLKRICTFIGVWTSGTTPQEKVRRKALTQRIEKMLVKGWTITNLTPRLEVNKKVPLDRCETCMICKESVVEKRFEPKRPVSGEKKFTGAGHHIYFECCRTTYHISCIMTWIKECCFSKSFASCPGCRSEIHPIDLKRNTL